MDSSSASVCAQALAPGIEAVSKVLNESNFLADKEFSTAIARCVELTGDIARIPLEKIKQQIDNKVLCAIMCCCDKTPLPGKDPKRDQYQNCVDATLHAADEAMGFKSRYKSEISYNMNKETSPHIPTPFMHRVKDKNGKNIDTTERSREWRGRARAEVEGYKPGIGYVRRPDIVVVNNPNEPPYQKNISRVIEMKFNDDRLTSDARRDYEKIAGGLGKFEAMSNKSRPGMTHCDCGKEEHKDPLNAPVLMPFNEKVKRDAQATQGTPGFNWGAAAEATGMSIVTGVGAVATAAAALVPLDGPVGEIVLGTATAAAGVRAAAAARAAWRSFKLVY